MALQSKPTVVLADDHKDVREEIEQLLREQFDVLAVAADGLELVEQVCAVRPDIVITDIHMPRLNGIDAYRQLLANGYAGAAIALSMFNDEQLIATSLQAGIRGFVTKTDAGEQLAAAVHAVLDGETYLSSQAAAQRYHGTTQVTSNAQDSRPSCRRS